MGEVQLEWRAVEADLLNTQHNGCYKHLMADGDDASLTVMSYYHSIAVIVTAKFTSHHLDYRNRLKSVIFSS